MAAGEMASMAHQMGYRGGIGMAAKVRDMRNRCLVSFILAIPVSPYSPLFTDLCKIQLTLPFGLSNQALSFLLATPAGVFYPAFGLRLRPEIAAISMSGSSLLVAVNALMLKHTKLAGIKPGR